MNFGDFFLPQKSLKMRDVFEKMRECGKLPNLRDFPHDCGMVDTYGMIKSGLAEKYVRIVQDMYDDSTTAVRCAVGVTEGFEVNVGLHQGSALSPCLFAMMMDRMTDEIREEAPWTMMFADDIVICSESKEQVEEKLES